MPPPAFFDSKSNAGPSPLLAPLAMAKACSLPPHRLNKANQSQSFSVCLCGPLVGAGVGHMLRRDREMGERREAQEGKEGTVRDPEALWGM